MAEKIKISPARLCAYKVLSEVLIKGAFSNIALNKQLPALVADSDVRLVTNIVYGTIKKQVYLADCVREISNIPYDDLQREVKVVLMMGLYQLFFLDKVPAYAVVNDCVNITKMFINKKTAGFINGVLRNALRKRDDVIKSLETGDFQTQCARKYGIRPEILDLLLKYYTEEQLILYLQHSEKPASVCLRTNTLKTTRDALLKRFDVHGIQAVAGFVPESIILQSHVRLTSLSEFKEGLFYVQDQAAMLPGHVLQPALNTKIWDMCAAPGGKSLHIAALCQNNCHILATDVLPKKLAFIQGSVMQQGADCIITAKLDATKRHDEYVNNFDYVLCDVPCSGLGVIGRKPEILSRITSAYIQDLKVVQKQILLNGLNALKKGGTLVYSTCTINPEENELLVKEVLSECPEVHHMPIHLNFVLPEVHEEMAKGYLKLGLEHENCDGFFIAKLTKM